MEITHKLIDKTISRWECVESEKRMFHVIDKCSLEFYEVLSLSKRLRKPTSSTSGVEVSFSQEKMRSYFITTYQFDWMRHCVCLLLTLPTSACVGGWRDTESECLMDVVLKNVNISNADSPANEAMLMVIRFLWNEQLYL
ncbi:hypothetical protein ACHQM5_008724 [Ranunculus cassubicifolius]